MPANEHYMDTSFLVPLVVERFSEDLHNRYKDIRKKPQRIEWPPYQPKSIVNVTVIHYKNKQTRQELLEISEHLKTGASGVSKLVSSPPSHSKVTKDVNEIFKVDPSDQTGDTQSEPVKLILIEGAPGIGKTMLAKEIAYLWADHKLLTDCNLVLLVFLRDPRVHKMKSIEELLQLYTTEKEASEVIDYLRKTNGQTVGFVFDGFDEFPVSQESSVVADILGISSEYGRKFCNSTVVVTSRPTATLFLQTIVDRRIEILGFAPEERDKLISQSVSQFPLKKIELEKYFKHHPIISSLCYIPLNLAILLYLFHQGNLPATLTEMNETFVIHTIYRHLKKLSPLSGCIYHLKEMPKNIVQILNKLSKLAFEKLQKNQLVFTDHELKDVCPEVYSVQEAANGLSLLQAVEHHPQKGVGTTTSFNFLHLTMQEYLAAYYVSTLPEEQQLELLQNKFWDGHFNFMWIMYVGTVGVKSSAFASYVSTMNIEQKKSVGRKSFNPIQQDKMKCLHLFQCYMEASSNAEIPQAISSIFADGNISLSGITLLSHHVTSLLLFMSTSVQRWKTLELNKCNLQRTEMNNLLHNAINNKESMSTLDYVDLSENSSSPWGVYCVLIANCCVNSLTLCGDEGMNDYIIEITDSLQANPTLKSLTLCSIGKIGVNSIKAVLLNIPILKRLNLSWQKSKGLINTLTHTVFSSDAIQTKTTVNKVVNVNILYIGDVSHTRSPSSTQSHGSKAVINLSCNMINDDAVHVLAFGLYNNKKVEQLNVSNNSITNEGAIAIIDCLKHNRKLKKLDLSQNSINTNGMKKMVKSIENQESTLSLEFVDLSKNSSSQWGVYCAIIRHCCINNLTLCGDEGMKEYVKEITDSLQANTALLSLTLCNIGKIGAESIKELAMNKITLKRLNLSWQKLNSKSKGKTLMRIAFPSSVDVTTDVSILYDGDISVDFFVSSFSGFRNTQNFESTALAIINLSGKYITDDAAHVLAFGLCNNATVEELNISNNTIANEGATAIIDCLKHNTALKKLDLSQNLINIDGMKRILESIENLDTAVSLDYIDLSKNDSSPWGPYSAIIKHCSLNSLTLCGDEGMEEYIKEITDSLQVNMTVQSLTLYNIKKVGVESLKAVLTNNCTLKQVNVSWHKIKGKDMEKILIQTSLLPNIDDIVQNKTVTSDSNRGININILYDELATPHKLYSSVGIENYESGTETVINLSCEVDDDAAHVLAFGLCNNTTVEELNISDKSITDTGALAIVDSLKHNTTMKKLDLSRNKISSNGMKKMLENIENQKTSLLLEYVDLSKNQASPWAVYCTIIKHSCVNSLTLYGDKHMKEYIKEIAKSLQVNATLQSIILLGVYIHDLKILQNVLNFYFLQAKVANVISKSSIAINSNMSCDECTPINIYVPNLNFDDDGVIDLVKRCNNAKIEKLDISHNNITDNGVVAICECLRYNETLKELDLSQNKISIIGMNKLMEGIDNQETLFLEYIDLSKNQASPWAVYCTIIKRSCVSCLTVYGDKQMKDYIKEIAKSLQVNQTLDSLTLRGVNIQCLELLKAALMFYLLQSKRVSLINEHTIIIKPNEFYDQCSPTINVSLNIDIDDDDVIDLVKRCIKAKVIKLKISRNYIHDNGIVPICESLKELDLSQNKLSIIGMNKMIEHIENERNSLLLEYVDLSKNQASPWAVYCTIIKHSYVNSLTLCGDEEMKENIKEIAKSLQVNTTLQSLTFPDVNQHHLELLQNALNFYFLQTKVANVIHEHTIVLNSNVSIEDSELTTINVCNIKITDDDIISLEKWVKLIKLNISNNNITDNGVIAICKCLKCNKTLKELDLSHNQISINGMNNMLEYIENQVETLSLQYVNLSKNQASPWGVYCAIIKRSCVNSLTLCGDEEMKENIKEIAKSLQINTTPQSLTLPDVDLHDLELLQKLLSFYLLQTNAISEHTIFNVPQCSLTTINASNININDDDVIDLVMRCNNSNIEYLNISHNNITDNGVVAICECLKCNETMKELDLSYNQISINGMNNMLVCIENQAKTLSLQFVDLSKNQASPWGVYCAIIKYSFVNILTLCGDKEMEKYINDITFSLQMNRILQSLTLYSIGKIGVKSIKAVLLHVIECSLKRINLSWQKINMTDTRGTLSHRLFLFHANDAVMDAKKTVNNNISIYIMYHFDVVHNPLDTSFSNTACTENLESNSVINLSSKCITDDAAHVLAFGLCNNTTVEELNISLNELTDEGAIAIFDCLKYNKTLKKLDLSHNQLYSSMMFNLQKFIEKERITLSLEYVDLRRNIVSSPWGVYCAIIRHSCVNSLTLCGNSGMEDYNKAIARSLQLNATIESLTLLDANIDDLELLQDVLTSQRKGAHAVDEHTIVINSDILYDYDEYLSITIDLSNFNVNDDDVIHLVKQYSNAKIEKLNISHNNITDNGVVAICECLKCKETLKELDLSHNRISINGMNNMLECIENQVKTLSLEYVDLSKNQASPWGMYCTIIRHNCVNSLTLCGDEEMKEHIKEIAKSLQINATLQSLKLPDINKQHLELLENTLNFYFSQTKVANVIHEHTIVINSNVSIDDCKVMDVFNINIDDDDLISLVKLVKLTKLNISHNNITDNGVVAICECLKCNETLKELDLSQNKIGITGMNKMIENIENLVRPLSLEYVDLSKNQASPWAVYCTIIKHSCVNSLTLCGDEEMKENIKEIAKSLQVDTTLQSLTFPDVNQHHLELLQNALNFYFLQTKVANVIHEHTIVINSVVSIEDSELTTINVCNIKLNDDDIISLEKWVKLIKLNISNNNITDNGVIAICKCLKCDETLKELDLSHNQISINGMNNMLEYIENQVETLSLQYVNLSKNQASPWGVYCAIIKRSCVNSLTLCGDEEMNENMKEIAKSLQINTTPQSLTLPDVDLHDLELLQKLLSFYLLQTKVANAINEQMVSNVSYDHCSLTAINVSNTNIDDDDVIELAKRCNNAKIEKLDISHNNITDNGVVAIGECLKCNETLKELNLSHNKITINGMNSMLEYIENQVKALSLQYVDLSKNQASPWGVYCAIIKRSCVNSLTLCGDEEMKENIKEITKSLQRNTTLQSLTLPDVDKHNLELLQKLLSFYLLQTKVANAINEQMVSNVSYDYCSLTAINVSNTNIDDDDVIELAKRCNNAKIEKLNISNNNITDNGVVAICECLKCNETLKELDLSHNQISINGMNNMLEYIENQVKILSLQYVDLSKNQASPWGVYCAIIKRSCVNSLTLCGDEEMKENIKEIVKSVQVNTTLQLLALPDVNKYHLELLQNALNFYLLQTKVANAINEQMTSNVSSSLTTISVSNMNIDDDDVIDFVKRCNNAKIEKFNISHNHITDIGVVAICNFLKCKETLKELDLSHNKINIKGMNSMLGYIENQMRTLLLQYVDLSKNQASPWGVYCAIIKHSCVNSLTLCGDEGMEEYIKEITCSIQANITLQSLTLCSIGKIGVKSIKAVLSYECTLERVNLSWQKVSIADTGSTLIHKFHANDATLNTKKTVNNNISIYIMYHFDVVHSPLDTSFSDTACTENRESNSVINLSSKSIDDDAAHVLAFGLCNNTTVEELNVSLNEVSDEGAIAIFDCLKYNKTLKKLDLSQNQLFSFMMFNLQKFIEEERITLSLEYVDLSRNIVSSPWGVYCAIIRHSNVSYLTVCGDEKIKEHIKEIEKSLQLNMTIQSLTLLDANIDDLELLQDVLTSQRIGAHAVDEHTIVINSDILYDEYSSTTIDVPNFNVNDDDVIHLVKQYSNAKIEKLNISHNNITDNGVVAICEILKCKETLKELDLSHNQISINGMNNMLECIENQVKTLSLQYVDLSNNQASPWAVYYTIVKHCYVNDLTLGGDEEMKEHVKEIAKSLQVNAKLQSLTLSDVNKHHLELLENTLNFYFSQTKVANVINEHTIVINSNVSIDDCELTTINVCNININDDDIIDLVKWVKLTKLNISNNNITDNGVVAICECLKCNETLKELDLSQNKINITGMSKMIESIGNLVKPLSLEYVDLSKNQASPWAVYCTIIKHSYVNSLTLCGDEEMKENIKEIVKSVQVNTTLQLLALPDVNKYHLELLQNALNFYLLQTKVANAINEQMISNVSSSPTTISVSNINIDDDGVIDLMKRCDNAKIEKLNISYNDITDNGVVAICECLKCNETLKELDLSQNRFTIDGMSNMLEYIENQAITLSLQYVDLSKNQASPWAVYCAIIRHCYVNNLTFCGDEGMEEYTQGIAYSLQSNKTLQSLTLCGIGKIGVKSIKAVLLYECSLKSINLSWQKISMKDAGSILTHKFHANDAMDAKKTVNDNISIYIMYHFDVVHSPLDTSFSDTASAENLELNSVINLSSKCITDDAAHVLAFGLCNNTTVEELNVSLNELTDEGAIAIFDCLKYNKTLKKLDLSQNKLYSTMMLNLQKYIEENRIALSLEYVNLTGNIVSSPWGVYCAIIRHSCVNNLTFCGDVELKENIKEIAKSLQANLAVQSLTLPDVNEHHLELLRNSLSFYLLQTKVANAINKQMISNVSYDHCSLTTVNVSNTNIDDDDVMELAKQCNNAMIEKLNISNNNITDNGVVAICECLKCNETLKEFDLSQNKIGFTGMNKIIKCIENQRTLLLEYVDLSKNQASPWGVYCTIIKHSCVNSLTLCGDEEMSKNIKEIAKSLQVNTTLQSLTLPDINKYHLELLRSVLFFQNKVANAVHECTIVLNSNMSYDQTLFTTFTTINVSNINIDDDDVINLMKQCNHHSKIESFNISHNDITDNGVVAILECLKHNKTLKELDLSHNHFSINGMNNMIEYIENQVRTLSLEYVDLSNNKASPWGIYCTIVKHCHVNNLTLCGDEGMEEYINDITFSLQINRTLQSLTLCSIGKVGVKSIKAVLLYECSLKRINLSWQKINMIDTSRLINKLFSFHKNIATLDAKKTVNNNISIYIMYHFDVIHSPLDTSFPDTACAENLESNSVINLSSKSINDDAAHVLAFGLCNNTTVEELNISLNEITDEGAIAIFDCLKYNKTLKKLDLSQNKLYFSMMLNMQNFLEENRITLSLEYVDLRKNISSPWGVYCAIIRHSCVNSLTLCGIERMKEYIKEIAKSLQLNLNIESLTLLDANMDDLELLQDALNSQRKGAHAVNEHTIVINSDVPYDEYSSTTIDVSNFNVNDDDVINLVKRCNNAKIEKLVLSHNNITDNGVVAICECLKYNRTLKELDLSQNKIGIAGMNKMIESIENQRTSLLLEYVDLSKNQAPPWAVYCTIIKHSCVNSLILCGDEGMQKNIEEIAKSLQVNTTLQILTLPDVNKDHLELLQNALNFYFSETKVADVIHEHTIVINSVVSIDNYCELNY